MAVYSVKFMPENRTIDVEEGTSLLKAASMAGILIKSGCGGKGSCGACKVLIMSGKPQINGFGNLNREQISKGWTLACETFVTANLAIEVPPESRLKEHQVLVDKTKKNLLNERELNIFARHKKKPLVNKVRIKLSEPTLTDNTGDFTRLQLEIKKIYENKIVETSLPILQELSQLLRDSNWDISVTLAEFEDKVVIIKVESGNDFSPFGLAIDIGTTTIVVSLIDLNTDDTVTSHGTYNRQAKYGDDVISRIVYATDSPENLESIRQTAIETINELIDKILTEQNLKQVDISCAVIAGNTTMTQLFYGINPRYIRLEPYIPTLNFYPPIEATKTGLHMLQEGFVYSFPCIASYVGGDIVSGTLVSRISDSDELVLFIDIGTNGEIVLGNKDWLVSCACSAGPCFEGGGITFGMRAMPGAIEHILIDKKTLDVKLKVVGGVLPVGICGSGLVDCLSQLKESGVIDRAGNYQVEHSSGSQRIRITPDDKEFVLAWAHQAGGDKDIVISENDVKNLIRAKGAIYAGIRTLLQMLSVELDMLDRIVIAGGFGNYLNVEDSIRIGLLPDLPRNKFEFIGNASVKGAKMALLSQSAWQEAEELGKKMTYIELSIGSTFMDEFVSALFIPHTDFSQFPSVLTLDDNGGSRYDKIYSSRG